MTESLQRQSAKVYQFPAGGRAGFGGRRDVAKLAEQSAMPHAVKVATGGAWYHEEAIQDMRRG